MSAQTLLLILLTVIIGFGSALAPGGPPPGPSPDAGEHAPAPVGPRAVLAVVTGDAAPLYAAADAGHAAGQLAKEDPLIVLEDAGSRLRVRTADGREGYVPRPLVRLRTAPPVPENFRVLGYYMNDPDGASRRSLEQNKDTLTDVAPWTWGVTARGELVTVYFDERRLGELLSWAGRNGLKTQALVHNFNPAKGAFDPELADALLSNAAARRAAVQNIVDTAARWGLSGVHVDFEGVPAARRDDLTSFMAELARRAHEHGLEVSMAVPAKTAAAASALWSAAYDYRALAEYVDFLMIMAYDQHWRGGAPGPVAALPWVRDVIEYALDPEGGAVPPDKLLLGVPVYGYDWPAGGGWADAVTYAQTMARLGALQAHGAGVTVRWHPGHRSPFFTYSGRTVWYENAHSAAYKLLLAAEYGLGGVAFWRLGQEDPHLWDVLRRAVR